MLGLLCSFDINHVDATPEPLLHVGVWAVASNGTLYQSGLCLYLPLFFIQICYILLDYLGQYIIWLFNFKSLFRLPQLLHFNHSRDQSKVLHGIWLEFLDLHRFWIGLLDAFVFHRDLVALEERLSAQLVHL